MIGLTVNGQAVELGVDPSVPLLWVLRDRLALKGTKYGCGVGVCGSCTVLLDGRAVRACVTLLGQAAHRAVTTIEALAQTPSHPLIEAWVAEQVPQCGYCQPAQIMAAAALLAENPNPSDAHIDQALSAVLCRCGTYQRIRRAIHRAAERGASAGRATPAVGETPGAEECDTVALNPWVRVGSDDTVTVVIDRSEMGQGVLTSLAMLVAEELEVDLTQVRTVFAPADPTYNNRLFDEQITGGSTSVRAAWEPLRRAGAAAREQLIAAAARVWGAAREQCRASNGKVIHEASGRSLGYGMLAARAAAEAVPECLRLKTAEQFRLIGKPLLRLDVPAMATGRVDYGMDVVLPGMRVAAVRRCPVPGGRVRRWDASAAQAVAGVRQVRAVTSGVAVLADDVWSALQGRDALEVTWEEGPAAALDSATIERRLVEAAQRGGEVVRESGSPRAAWARAARRIEALYYTPYLAHATMEPMNCTARVDGGRCEVWVGTQNQSGTQAAAARAAGLPANAVEVHTTFLGGGFGRRGETDFVAEAVELAKALAAPIQVVWSRDDDMRHDFLRPANVNRLRGALGGRGLPTVWWQCVAGPPLSLDGVHMDYAIAHQREEHVVEDPGIPTGAWRAVGASQNAFAVECFIDELAHAAGQDPLAYRCRLLAHEPRMRAVLELAGEKAGWGTPPEAGCYRGVAAYRSFASRVAEVVELSVSGQGAIRVHRVVCAIDCGLAINPDTIAAQMEGAVIFGLSAALLGEITVRGGRVVQGTFEDYPILTMAQAPVIEVHIVASGDPPGGVGEPGVPPIAPAVANALFAATGQRVRRLPLLRQGSTPGNGREWCLAAPAG